MKDRDDGEQDPRDAHREEDVRPKEASREDHLAGKRDSRELLSHMQRQELGEVLAVDEEREPALAERAEGDERGENEGGVGRPVGDEAEEVDGDHHEREAEPDDDHGEGEGGGEERDCG